MTVYYATAGNYNGGKPFRIYLETVGTNTEMITEISITDTDKNPPTGDTTAVFSAAVAMAVALTILVKQKKIQNVTFCSKNQPSALLTTHSVFCIL